MSLSVLVMSVVLFTSLAAPAAVGDQVSPTLERIWSADGCIGISLKLYNFLCPFIKRFIYILLPKAY